MHSVTPTLTLGVSITVILFVVRARRRARQVIADRWLHAWTRLLDDQLAFALEQDPQGSLDQDDLRHLIYRKLILLRQKPAWVHPIRHITRGGVPVYVEHPLHQFARLAD